MLVRSVTSDIFNSSVKDELGVKIEKDGNELQIEQIRRLWQLMNSLELILIKGGAATPQIYQMPS